MLDDIGNIMKNKDAHILSKTEENMLNLIFGAVQIMIFFVLCMLLFWVVI